MLVFCRYSKDRGEGKNSLTEVRWIMRKMNVYACAVGLIFALAVVSALPAIPSETKRTPGYTREEIYTPPKEECEKFDICDLKLVILRTQDEVVSKIDEGGIDIYGTKMYASYVTDALSGIEKYAFVQFIRGCQFVSQLLPSGEVENYPNILRPYMDTPEGLALFRHPDWAIDSEHADPIQSSDPSLSDNRHFLLQWTTPPGAWNPDISQGNLYGEKRPKFPRVYVTDSPFSAVRYPDELVRNSSLEFRICLYKTADVPRVTSGNNIGFAVPIKCFEWDQSFVYNYGKKSWERPVGVVAECKRPLTKEEEAQSEVFKYLRKNRPQE